MNPELTCFPIEEDPSTSGENENKGEVAGTNQMSHEDISSKVMTCGAKREHLAELTDACVDPATSVSAVERFPDRSSFDSVNTDISFNGTCSMVKEKHGNLSTKKRRCTNGAKGNQTSSVSTNCVKKVNEPLKNRIGKPKLSRKTSLRNGGQSPSEESKPNNIVSNISSFVPLIQQKQAAAVVTGKRNIKVRALEAAEAAKRVEEKIHNECKMKKEALKLERTRTGQENLHWWFFLMLLLQFEGNFGYFAVAAAFLRMSLAAFDVVAAEFWRFSLSIVTAETTSLLFAVSWSLY
ncbi:hypothetical protein U1Q18_003180 [Sarracenia purpurea var. burkii]